MRSRHTWKLRSRTLELGARTLIMGIVNVTPDSFSDGGEYFHSDLAVEHALKLLGEGADILDIGGESTRPGNKERVSAIEELRRVMPVIKALRREAPDAVISIDTYKAEVAERAITAGAEIINDVSGFAWDPHMAAVAARLGCGCVLMHMRGTPEEWRMLPPISSDELLPVVLQGLRQSAAVAERAGVKREAIALDPGLGFGKNYDENFPLLARLQEIVALGFPLLAGASRKSFIANAVAERRAERDGRRSLEPRDLPAEERLYGTLAANVAAILRGAHILRVHDVAAARDAAAVADKVVNAVRERH